MSKPDVQQPVAGEQEFFERNSFEEMMKLFEEMTFREKWAKIQYGLKQPKDTGAYKWSRLQMLRLTSVAAGIVVPLLMVLLMALLAAIAAPSRPPVQVQIREELLEEVLKEPEEIVEPEIIPPDPTEIVINDTFINSTSKSTSVGPDADFSPQPSPFDAVAIIKSPVIMKGVFGSRSPGARGSMLGRFGGSGHTEGAVLRALRWLKKYQEQDGCWNGTSGGGAGRANVESAMTGLALLTYLAHGETPASPEFGVTVDKTIKWLLQKAESGGFPRPYQHPIATYALAEAYSMTKVPSLKAAAAKCTDVIISGQNPGGGFDYQLNSNNRNDTSVMGWCAQALKAAKIAGVESPGLDAAMKKGIDGFKGNFQGGSDNGGFGYTGPGKGGLSGVGALCMQLLGQPKAPEVMGTLNHLMQTDNFTWAGGNESWKKVYYWYYSTQARFHEGGECWKSWNKMFSLPLVKAQIIIPKAIQAPSGKMVDIGYWDATAPGGRVMDTTLCALMLQVYYRYLPTFQKAEEIVADVAADAAKDKDGGEVKAKDLDIEIKM